MELGKLGERWASRTMPRFSLFREGRTLYEEYLNRLEREFCDLSESDFAQAQSSPELQRCESLYQQSLRLCRKDDAYHDIAVNCYQLGLLYHLQGRFREAEELLTEALEIADSLPRLVEDEIRLMSGCCYHLGILAARAEKNDAARDFFARSLRLDESLADLPGVSATRRAMARFLGDSEPDEEDTHEA